MCELCGYNSNNINKHQCSSVHKLGLSRVIYGVKRLYMIEWVQRELIYQREHCPLANLNELVSVHAEINKEFQCATRNICDTIVERQWEKCASAYRDIMTMHYRDQLLIAEANLPEEICEYIIKLIPECQDNYLKLLNHGVKNFQILNSDMGHRRSPTSTMSSVATESRTLISQLERKWSALSENTVATV